MWKRLFFECIEYREIEILEYMLNYTKNLVN